MTAPKRPASVTDEHLAYLDDLRESGSVNMALAAPELVDEFGIDKTTAREVARYWRDSFAARHPA